MPNSKFWTELFPNESIEEGKQLLQELHWNIALKHDQGLWAVHAGHQLLLTTTSEEAVEALLYGMALSYHAMPKPLLEQLRKTLDRDAGSAGSGRPAQ